MQTTNDEKESILRIARQMYVDSKLLGRVVERAALLGAYDNGTDIQQFMEEATRVWLKQREEGPVSE